MAYVFTLYTALIVFYVSSGIFNTLYPYGLREGSLSKTWMTSLPALLGGVSTLGVLGGLCSYPAHCGVIE